MIIRVVGIGMCREQLTVEAEKALRSSDYVLAADKGADDELLAVRRALATDLGLPVVTVADPERDRKDPRDYPGAVRDWHAARVDAFERAIRSRSPHHPGDPAFLVWGDPSLYDSTIRIVEQLASRLGAGFEVIPGISAPSLLAARHRIVLHRIGRPVHLTTARLLPEAIGSGQRNILVMLTSGFTPPAECDDWQVWWGANLGTSTEALVSGRVDELRERIADARTAVKAAAGWVMDCYLLQAS